VKEQLKPCPFCGTKPHPITADLLTRPCFYYECENKTCHAAEKGWHDTEQEAIDAWNARPIEDALNAELAQLRKDNQELRNRIESIETKTEELHLAVYGYGTAHDSAEYVLDNLIIDKDKVNGIVARIKNLKSDNQSLVEQMNAMAKKLEDAETKLLWKSIQT